MFKERLHNIHIKLSMMSKLMKLFIKLRNQLNSIINFHKNGESLFVKNVIDDGSVILDVVANLGQYTENVLKIHLLEPAKNIFKVFNNKFDNNKIYCHNIALSDTIENKDFFELNNFGETFSFFINQKEKATKYSVEANTIDVLLGN